jgi:nitrate/nitrite transport system substrate-binding protein
VIDTDRRDYTFAQTFPTGTHAMWLYYWLAAHGIHPLRDVKTIVVPPPQMVANMRAGNMDGFCVGEPWGARAIAEGVGFTAATTQEIWPEHPEKVLGCTRDFVRQYPNTARALILAMLEAVRYLDDQSKRAEVAELIAGRPYLNVPVDTIEQRFRGVYDNGIGRRWKDEHALKFHDGGQVNFPYYSDAMWFMTQQRRWGLLKAEPDYLAVAKAVNQVDLYKEAAGQLRVSLPASPLRASTLFDGKVWDGSDPRAYAASFALRVERPASAPM